MAMRETVRSMRVFLILTGVLALFPNLGFIFRRGGGVAVPILGLIGIFLASEYIYIGLKLRAFVATNAPVVTKVFYGTSVFLVLFLVLGLTIGPLGVVLVAEAALGLLINWYLLRNFRRLVREAQEASGPTPPPTA